MRGCLQGLVPRREVCFASPKGMRLRYLTLYLTISSPQTFSAMSLWEWSLAGLLTSRSVPPPPTLTGGGDLSKAGSMVMTTAGHPTWIPTRNISRYLLGCQRVCKGGWVLMGKGIDGGVVPHLEWPKGTK